MSAAPAARPDVEVLIVGSGFAGLGMAIRLLDSGRRSFLVLEKAGEVGGTWRDNTYPGCACDIPSHLYSFSFEPRVDWSRMYPTQPEIQDYLRQVAERRGLRPHIRLNAELREAAFDEAANLWRVATADGAVTTARVLVSAMGGLSRPAYPDIPGLDRFRGPAFHSARWDHGVDLRGKRVAVVGTGASAVQFVPRVQPLAARLSLFQRTPPWVLPKEDRPIGRRERLLMRWVPGYRQAFRNLLYWRCELRALGFLTNARVMRLAERQALAHLAAQVGDPALRAALTPGYAIGCKRVLISNDYYPALGQPNVELVTDPIAEVREDGVALADGRLVPADVLIHGTGFRATDLLTPVRILGRGGLDLNDAWRDGMEAYLGTVVAGFPNLFLLVGPNTGLGHNSIVFMIEAQVDYVLRCLALVDSRGGAALEVRAEAQARFNAELRERMRRTVWASGCRSWYLDKAGRNTTLWPGFTVQFWRRTRRVRAGDFHPAPACP